MDENGSQGSDKLPVAPRVERDRSVFSAHIREAGLRRNLSMEELHETTGDAPRLHRHGLDNDAIREDREAGG